MQKGRIISFCHIAIGVIAIVAGSGCAQAQRFSTVGTIVTDGKSQWVLSFCTMKRGITITSETYLIDSNGRKILHGRQCAAVSGKPGVYRIENYRYGALKDSTISFISD